MGLEIQNVKSIKGLCDPGRAIRLLYANTLRRLMRLLRPHLVAVKEAADTYIQLGLPEQEEHVTLCDIQSAESVSELLGRMSVKATWESTCFLQQAVDEIPAKTIEREVAEMILSHYNHHLAIYNEVTPLKDELAERKKSECVPDGNAAKQLVPVEITSSKSYNQFTCGDCCRLLVDIVTNNQAYGIPKERISCLKAAERKSTTVIFLVPSQYSHTIMQRSSQLLTVWILLELGVIEVAIPGIFTFIPSVQYFLTLLSSSGGRTFTDDLLRVTEVRGHCTL